MNPAHEKKKRVQRPIYGRSQQWSFQEDYIIYK